MSVLPSARVAGLAHSGDTGLSNRTFDADVSGSERVRVPAAR
jgi:hypothetical protein